MTTKEKKQEVAELLPWYANGTLDEADRKKVEGLLKTDAGLRHQLELIHEDQSAARELAEETSLPASLQSRFNAAMNADIERNARASTVQHAAAGSGLLVRFAAFMTPPRLAMATAAAAAVIAVQAAVLLTQGPVSDRGSEFQTASGGEQAVGEGIVFLVKLKPDATIGQLSAFLEGNNGRVVDGPGQSGLYRLSFAANEDDPAAISVTLGQATDLFEIVLPGGK